MAAPGAPPDGYGRLYKLSGDAALYWISGPSGTPVDITSGSASTSGGGGSGFQGTPTRLGSVDFGRNITMTGSVTSGSLTISGLPSTSNLYAGMFVTGSGIAVNTQIYSIDSTTSVSVKPSGAITTTATESITFAASGTVAGVTSGFIVLYNKNDYLNKNGLGAASNYIQNLRIAVTNRNSSTSALVKIADFPTKVPPLDDSFILHEVPVIPNESKFISVAGLRPDTNDGIFVFSDTNNVAFSVFGLVGTTEIAQRKLATFNVDGYINSGNAEHVIYTSASGESDSLSFFVTNQSASPAEIRLAVVDDTVADIISFVSGTPAASSNWASVVYGGTAVSGQFVASAGSSSDTVQVMRTFDGLTWTSATVPQQNGWKITYGNGLFVGVSANGAARVMRSIDGANWISGSAAQQNSWTDVTYGNGLFVAVSADGSDRVMTSSNSVTWTSRFVPQRAWSSITFGNGIFVAISSSAAAPVMYSYDTITWTEVGTIGASLTFSAVTFGNGLFVAVGTNAIATSSDGINWTSRTSPASNAWTSVKYGNGLFVAVGTTGTNRVMVSNDGVNWALKDASTASAWNSVAFGNGKFVSVGSGSAMVSSGMITVNTDNYVLYDDTVLPNSTTSYNGSPSNLGLIDIGPNQSIVFSSSVTPVNIIMMREQ